MDFSRTIFFKFSVAIWSKIKIEVEAEKAEAEAEKRLLEQSEEMVKWIIWEEPKMPKSEKAKPEENTVQVLMRFFSKMRYFSMTSSLLYHINIE